MKHPVPHASATLDDMPAVKKHPTKKRVRKKRPPTGNPMGRPPALDKVIGVDKDGKDITTADQLVNGLAANVDVYVIAAAAGVSRSSLQDFLRTGARTLTLLNAGQPRRKFTKKQLLCADFSDRALRADGSAEVRTLGDWDRVARGGQPLETVKVKQEMRQVPVLNDDGTETGETVERLVVVQRDTTTTATLPDWKAMEARLRYRHPDRYAVNRLDVSVGSRAPLDQPIDDETLALSALATLKAIDVKSKEA